MMRRLQMIDFLHTLLAITITFGEQVLDVMAMGHYFTYQGADSAFFAKFGYSSTRACSEFAMRFAKKTVCAGCTASRTRSS